MKKPIYWIHEASEEVGVHESTIRRLEQRGVINPSRTLAGHRVFTEDDLRKIREFYTRKKS